VQFLQQAVNFLVRKPDWLDIFELEQLVAIPDFDVGEMVVVIIIERAQVNGFVVRKAIRPGVVAAMHVAEEDQPVAIGELDPLGGFKNSGQYLVITHNAMLL